MSSEREKRILQEALSQMGVVGIDITDQVRGATAHKEKVSREEQIEAVSSTFGQMHALVVKAQNLLDTTGINSTETNVIDEVALYYKNEATAHEAAVQMTCVDTISVFNVASDHVHTEPIKECYDVTYRFIKNTLYPWRVEIMSIDRGISPLHYSMASKASEEAFPVHVSFKVETKEIYLDVLAQMRDHEDWTLVQSCESDYGWFSYFRHDSLGIYVKPRVNVRDA